MTDEKTWEEFRQSGLLWWINRQLHLFGWAIVQRTDESGQDTAYPARVPYWGFSRDVEDDGFKKLTAHLSEVFKNNDGNSTNPASDGLSG